MSAVGVDREGRLGWFGYLDLGTILASVFAGLGVTLLLVAFGSAVGIEAADDGGDETRISSIVGTWTVISALLGTLIGTFIGGRYSRYQSAASAIYNAVTSWGFVQVLALWLAGNGIAGLLAGGLRSVQETPSSRGGTGHCREGVGRGVVGRLGARTRDALHARGCDRRLVGGLAVELADAETEDVGVTVRR